MRLSLLFSLVFLSSQFTACDEHNNSKETTQTNSPKKTVTELIPNSLYSVEENGKKVITDKNGEEIPTGQIIAPISEKPGLYEVVDGFEDCEKHIVNENGHNVNTPIESSDNLVL